MTDSRNNFTGHAAAVHGDTPLHHAARVRDTRKIVDLIHDGADMGATNMQNQKPRDVAGGDIELANRTNKPGFLRGLLHSKRDKALADYYSGKTSGENGVSM